MSSRLHVCLVTTFFPPENFGGDGIHVSRLALALGRRGHRVTVVYSRDAYAALRPGVPDVGRATATSPHPNVTVHGLGSPLGRLSPLLVHQLGVPIGNRRRLRRLLEGGPGEPAPDVVHFHNVSLVGGAGILSWGRGVKLYTAHEYWLMCPTHLLFRFNREVCHRRTCVRCTLSFGRPPQWWRYSGLLERRMAHLDGIVAPSRLTSRVYSSAGVDTPLEVLPHFLPDAYVRNAAQRGPRRAAIPPYCLYVGRLDRVKGLHTVLGTFADRRVGLPLWIAGVGPEERNLRRACDDAKRVRFLGWVEEDRLGELYRDATALLLPSAGYETFGLVVLEAFAHGTPAVVSSIGGGRELVEASGAGYVYSDAAELCAAVRRLADRPELRDRLGEAGRRHVTSRHDESGYLQRYETMIRRCRERRVRVERETPHAGASS